MSYMTKRTLWLPVLTTLLCASQATLASARDGFTRFGMVRMPMRSPEVSMRRHFPGQQQLDVRHSLQVHGHHLRPRGSLPVAIWPYEPYIDTPLTPVAPTESKAAPAPQVIVIQSDNPARVRPTQPEAPLDFSYVPECKAIPNGYHCGDHHGPAKGGDGARGGAAGLSLSE